MMKQVRRGAPALIAVILLLLAGVSFAQDPQEQGSEGFSAGREEPTGPASPSASMSTADADRDWRFVQKLKDDGMFDVAARQLAAFADKHADDPRAPGALLEAASIYRRLDQPVNALDAYQTLLDRFPTSKEAPRALLNKGELLVESHRWEEAASTYRDLLSSFPASSEADAARLGLGESMMALDRRDEAARLFRYLVGGRAAPPLAARALFDLGVLAQKAGQDSLAVVRFDSVHESYPQEVVGAFGLLRSAEILAANEAPDAARERYEAVNDHYQDPYLQARAELGLAILDEQAHDWKSAARRYRSVAERGGSPEQVQRALLGLGESELQAGRPKKAREAADAFLQKYPKAKQAEKARLLAARADAARGEEAAQDELRALTRSDDHEVAYQAFSTLAGLLEGQADEMEDAAARDGKLIEARDLWRSAATVAPDADSRAQALAEAARIAAEKMGRPALAAELYREASEAAESTAQRAELLYQQIQQEWAAGEEDEARADAERLITAFPLSPQAAQTRTRLRWIERRSRGDAQKALGELSKLALQDEGDAFTRRLEVARVLRDVAGDAAGAATLYAAAAREATGGAEAARARYELARTLLQQALDAALEDPSSGQWESLWDEAAAAFQEAESAQELPAEQAAEIRLARWKMKLAEAASSIPPLFNAELDPLLAGMGEQEALDFAAAPWPALAADLEGMRDRQGKGARRAWVLWRSAEITAAADSTQRVEWLQEGLRTSTPQALQMRLRYTLGELLLGMGRGEEAARQFRQVMESPDSGEVAVAARYAMAELQRKQRRYSAARELYQAYAAAYPATRRGQRSLLLAGDMALYGGDADGAAAIYRSLLQRYPNGVYADDAQYRLATAQMRRGRREDARKRFVHLADPATNSRYAGRSLLKLSELESEAGHDSLAVEALSRLNEIDPKLAEQEQVPLKLARLELERGRPESALRWLGRLPDDAVDAEVLALRVQALAQAGKVKKAREALGRLDDGFPDAGRFAAAARCDLADAERQAHQIEAALEDYQRVEQEPVTTELRARALYGIGMTRLQQEHWDEARASFAAAAKAAPHSDWAARALFKVANLAARAGDDEQARNAYQQLVDDFPGHPLQAKAMKGLAVSWRRLDRYDKAVEVYHRLLEEHPDFPGAEQILSDIAYCYHELGKYELSIAAYQRVLPLLGEEDQAYAQFWIADSLEKLSRLDEAAAAYLKIPYLYPKSGQLPVTAQLKAARVYQRMGDVDSAVRLYRKVIDRYGPGSQWGAEAQRRLQAIESRNDADS